MSRSKVIIATICDESSVWIRPLHYLIGVIDPFERLEPNMAPLLLRLSFRILGIICGPMLGHGDRLVYGLLQTIYVSLKCVE